MAKQLEEREESVSPRIGPFCKIQTPVTKHLFESARFCDVLPSNNFFCEEKPAAPCSTATSALKKKKKDSSNSKAFWRFEKPQNAIGQPLPGTFLRELLRQGLWKLDIVQDKNKNKKKKKWKKNKLVAIEKLVRTNYWTNSWQTAVIQTEFDLGRPSPPQGE